MQCEECGNGEGEGTRVEYVDDTIETLYLCPDCRRDFLEGDLVSEVSSDTPDSR